MIKRTVLMVGLLLLGALNTTAWAGRHGMENPSFRLRLGLFTPSGNSEFWDDNEAIFTGDAGDFEDASFAAEFLWPRNDRVGVLFSVGAYEGSQRQSYRDYTDDLGNEVRHRTRFSVAPLTTAILVHLAPPDASVRPYVGAGAGFYWWEYRESGDFIDFDAEEIFEGRYESDGVTTGFFLLAGLEIPVRPNWSIFAEARWTHAKDELNDDLEDFGKIDLGGREVSAGVSWKF